MIDLVPCDGVVVIRYNYPFDEKIYTYAGVILQSFPVVLTQLLSILIDLKICGSVSPITYLADSEEISIKPDPQNYKYSYIGSLDIRL